MPGADSDIGVPVSHLTSPSLSGLEEKEFWPDSPIGSQARMSTIWAHWCHCLLVLGTQATDPHLSGLTLWDTEPGLSAFLLCPQLPTTH